MGAGVIPFCTLNGKVHFLFQEVFEGRKTGCLIDFGGGLGAGEDYTQTAMREFVEETETMFFSSDIQTASRSPDAVKKQLPIISKLFDKTLSKHPDWWCQRIPGNRKTPKDWRTYFVEVEYRDVEPINEEWRKDTDGRFKKRRKLVWVTSDALLEIYQRSPDKLWKRVRELAEVEDTIRSIQANKENRT